MARRDQWTAYALIVPVMAFLAVFIFYPAISTLWTSLTSYNLSIPNTRFVGLANFGSLLTSSDFWSAVQKSAIIVALTLPLDIAIGLVCALVVNERFLGRGLVRTLLILPWMLPPIVNGFMWSWILNGDYGALNGALYQLGIIHHYVQWLDTPFSQIVWVSVAQAWTHYPFSMLVILAGLQTIPVDLYEAAKMDGANGFRTFTALTFPLLKPTFAVAAVVGCISSFQIFDIIWSLSSGGSSGTTINPFTEALMVFNYATVFRDFTVGVGSALAYLILLISLVLGFAFLRVLRVQEAA